MTPTEALPLLVVVVLLVASSGVAVDEMSVVYDGDHELTTAEDVYVVAGGSVTVPDNASIDSAIYIVDGSLSVAGTVDGDVTVIGGNLTVAADATIAGTLQSLTGNVSVAPGAVIGSRSSVPITDPAPGPLGPYTGLVVQFVFLGLAAWVLARRRPDLLDTVGRAAIDHPVVTGVVGSLAGLTLLVLFVYMAFTLLLLPISILGLLGELLVVFYAYIAYGHRIGRFLPTDRTAGATVAGVGVVLLVFELLNRIPLVGLVVQIAAVAVGFGAVVVTFFGLREYHPATIPRTDR